MVISHSRKGFKSAEEVQAFLTRNAGISKEKVVLEMLRRFKLSYAEADKIYTDWRKRYIAGEIEDKEERKGFWTVMLINAICLVFFAWLILSTLKII
ncbi:MAG: hypothetical protein E7K00_14985 [Clostridium perfringens]|nr:hypothetical protein [Clostridium perfringens]